MHETQLAQFAAQVLQQGAEAVLPQHLSEYWLDALLEEADMFAPGAEDGGDSDDEADGDVDDDAEVVLEAGDPGCAGLLGAIIVLVSAQRGYPDEIEIPTETMMDYMQCYALALAAERVSRSTDIALDPPTVANIFDVQRVINVRRRPL